MAFVSVREIWLVLIHWLTSSIAVSSLIIRVRNSRSAGSFAFTMGKATPVCSCTRLLTASGWLVASSAPKSPRVKSPMRSKYQS